MKIIGERLKELLTQKGMEQKDLAIKLNLSPQTISGYITGYRVPNPDTLIKLADELNTTTDYLLGRTDKPNLELIDKNLPKELIDAGVQAIKVFKGLKVEDLTQNDIKYLIEFAEKVQKNRL